MRENYRQSNQKSNQKRTASGKRIGKSVENKGSGNFAKKSFVKADSGTVGKYSDRTAKSARKYSSSAESRPPRKIEGRTAERGGRKYTANTEGEPVKRYFKQNADKKFTNYKARSRKVDVVKNDYSEEIRLNRFIANSGVCSRREADRYIASGVVTVNGKVVTELGTKVSRGDEIRFDGRKLNAEKKVYLLLNKPKDFVTTTDDPHAEKTVMDLVKSACDERIYPVGRLDRNTTGVLLFTNDGDLSKKLTHPSHNMKKIYQVTLDKSLTKEHLLQIAEGVELEDGHVAADAISFINPNNRTEIGVEIHSGKNRIIRRIFEHLGYRIKKLDRVYFAGLTKKGLPRGKWRLLSEKEVHFLKMN